MGVLSKKHYEIKWGERKFRHRLKRKLRKKYRIISRYSEKVRLKRVNKYTKGRTTRLKEMKAPVNFSIIKNTEEVMQFFDSARIELHRDTPIKINLDDVTEMGPETITLMCALVRDYNFNNGTNLRGTTPNDPSIKKMFHEVSFYDFVIPQFNYQKDNKSENGIIHRITQKKVENELAGRLCISAYKHTYGLSDIKMLKNKTLHPILVECMSNTLNHAGTSARDHRDWWLIAYKETTTKITKFCFLDLGVGIFESLNRMYDEGNRKKWFMKYVPQKNNSAMLHRLFTLSGVSSTKKIERGRGLNDIYKNVTRDASIKNFTIISGNILATFDSAKKYTSSIIKSELKGTFYYWELHPYATTE